MAKRAVIEVWQSKNNALWYFHKKAANGKIASPSQGYSSNSNAHRAAHNLFPGLSHVLVVK